jgi:hypothetical protein
MADVTRPVRMGETGADGERVAHPTANVARETSERLREQLWLGAILGVQRRPRSVDRGPQDAQAIQASFLRVARRYSLCDDDAWDALAHGFEIAARNREQIRPDTAGAWFATVVRHEAMRIRRRRCRHLHLDSVRHEPPAQEPVPEHGPDPRLPGLREAMRELKPDERRALILFYAMEPGHADGGRYRRIMALS